MTSELLRGPVFIRSTDNPKLAFTVNDPTAGSSVTLETVEHDEWNSPRSQWVLQEIADGVYGIALYPSAGNLYLGASGFEEHASLRVSALAPANSLQFWSVEVATVGQYLATLGTPGFEAGFDGDIPIPGAPVTLQPAHDTHDLGDRFAFSAVFQQR